MTNLIIIISFGNRKFPVARIVVQEMHNEKNSCS